MRCVTLQARFLLNPVGQVKKNSLSSIIKSKLLIDQASISCYSQHHRNSPHEQLSKATTAKINNGNIKSALRLLLSDDKLAKNNDDSYKILLERHSAAAKKQTTTTCTITLKYLFASIGTRG